MKLSAVASLVTAAALAAALAAATPGAAAAATAARSTGFVTIAGSGSSWQSVAILTWAEDVGPALLTVNFNPDGSAAGRGDYLQGSQVDFAASDVPFRNGHDKLGGTRAEVPPYGYSYIPGPAGGVAFVYHVSVHGHLLRNLRLSARTLMEIFTGQITNWDSPQITKDTGQRLPDLRIAATAPSATTSMRTRSTPRLRSPASATPTAVSSSPPTAT